MRPKIYKLLGTMAHWGIGEELSDSFQANRAMELFSRDTGPRLGHIVSYYVSDEVWTAMLGLPEAIKHGGDTDEMRLEFAENYDRALNMCCRS